MPTDQASRARRVRRAAREVLKVQDKAAGRLWQIQDENPGAWDVMTPKERRRLWVAARTLAKEAK